MARFRIVRVIDAPVNRVWRVVGDFMKAPGPGVAVEIERTGSPKSHDVGAIRSVTIGKRRIRERLESINPPRAFTYTILSGAPLKNHLGMVELLPKGKTTEIRWEGGFTPRIPGTGLIVSLSMKRMVGRYINEIEKAVASRHS